MSRDRFTERDRFGKVRVEIMPVEATAYQYIDQITELGRQDFLFGPALDRLAAYEDLAFSPDTLRGIIDEWKAWADAKNEGRLVVVPCSAKAEIEHDGRLFHGDHWNGPILTAFADDLSLRGGKRAMLFSVAEIEAAQKEGRVK